MTTTIRWVTERWRWVLLPMLAFVALASWAFASPVGASPDDDYHLVSIWCASGGSEYCEQGSEPQLRVVAQGFREMICFAQDPKVSAGCQDGLWARWSADSYETKRGNFYGEYPPVYYGVQRLFAGDDVQFSALVMRLVNAALFVGLATALAALSTPSRRRTVVLGWAISLVPLGMFLISSNNPSGWALTGVGTAFVALLGWMEQQGGRRWVLGALYLVGVVMAAGSRGDAAAYVAGATVTALIITFARTRPWLVRAALPAVGLVISAILLTMAGQAAVGSTGFTGGGSNLDALGDAETPATTLGLIAYNVLMIPFLWTGVWGSWGLGWLDTMMPAVVLWGAAGTFVVVGFAGLRGASVRKMIVLGGVLTVLVSLPVYVLTKGGDTVGSSVQPRYLLPLIALLCFLLVTESGARPAGFGRLQTAVLLAALSAANLVALQVNIRRYVTGIDQQGADLDAGSEWWWSGSVLGPNAVWLIGSVAFAGALALVWPFLREGVETQPRASKHADA